MGGRKGKSMTGRGEGRSHGRGVVDGNMGCACCTRGAPWEGWERKGRGKKGVDMLHRRGHHRREVGREGDATMGGGGWGGIFNRGRASIGGRGRGRHGRD